MEKASKISRDIIFVCLSCVLVGITILRISTIPSSQTSHPVSEIRSEKSKYLKDPLGYPDKFNEYFREAVGVDQGYTPYPQGYQIQQYQEALFKNAKRGRSSVELAWVERGPGNVGGRSRAVIHDPSDPTLNTWFVASVGGGVWRGQRSTQFGLDKINWESLTDDLPSLAATTLAMSENNPNVMYVGTGEGFGNVDASGGTGIFRTNDRGVTWTHLPATANPQSTDWRYVNRLIVHPDNPDIVVAVTNTGIFRTENGGQSFSKVYSSTERVQDLKAHPSDFNIQYATVNSTAILRSSDGGKTWETSFDFFRYPPNRIEVAISQSNPNVIWASVYGSGSPRLAELFGGLITYPISDLYRSVDGGQTWRYIEPSRSTEQFDTAFLGGQGWYNNTILVDPFSPDMIYIGGVEMFKASIDSGRPVEESSIGVVTGFNSTADYINFVSFRGSAGGGRLAVGYIDEASDVEDVTVDDMVSVEVRFGPGLTQKAHRFTVDPSGGASGDGGAGISIRDYLYADYIDVPFQVWDVENNRQLMISFRDQGSDGEWSLIAQNTSGPGNTQSREYLFISKYAYNATAPHPDLSTMGGVRNGLLYFFWPTLDTDGPIWNPNSPLPGIINIDFRRGMQLTEIGTIQLWEEASDKVHVDHHALVAVPDGSNNFHILNANDGGIAYSQNSGKSWKEGDEAAGMNTSQFYDATKRPGLDAYIGGTQDNSTWISRVNPNSESVWRGVLGGDGFDVIWKSPDSLMGTSQFNMISRSLDGGRSWEDADDFPNNWNGQFLTTLGWTLKSGEAVFTYSPEAGAIRSLDFGASWHQLYPDWTPLERRTSGAKLRVSLADPSVVWYGSFVIAPGVPGNLHVSEDALNSISKVRTREVNIPESAPVSSISGVATHPLNRATAYIMFSAWCQPKLFRTEDLGRSWEHLSGFPEDRPPDSTAPCPGSDNGFPDARVWDLEVFPQIPWVMWAATDIGIFESRNRGETWEYADNGLPAVSVWRIRIVDDEVILATHGRGVWTLPIDQVQTHVTQDAVELPDSFELLANYPNPFNPTTSISFRVANNSHIRIAVFDVLGRKVATLVDQPFEKGSHQIQWDASSVSSGQYIYRMEADGKVIGARSMILIK